MASTRTLTESQQLALDTIRRRPTKGIAIWLINPMEWRMIDRLAGVPEGTYQRQPVDTYRRMQENAGGCLVDQWIPENPLSIGDHGYDGDTASGATTGATRIVRDGVVIDSPEAVAEHMERFAFPGLARAIAEFDADAEVARMLANETRVQAEIGPRILKAPYADCFGRLPAFGYFEYGYVNYFAAYGLYPDMMERSFRLQADYAALYNAAAACAIREGDLPPMVRLDHDMCDARGPLVNIRSLEQIWFPHFERSIRPLAQAGVTLLWHCDGNVTPMVQPMLECGLQGFQGFQYEDGVDYERICRMKDRNGEPLFIIAGVSVTRTLPHGTPDDVRKEMRWLVEHGPRRGLVLGCSSSMPPGVPRENLRALTEGFWHYRTRGRE
jgi:hypothetical protein